METEKHTEMSLAERRQLFTELIAEHIIWLHEEGYRCYGGDFSAKIRNPLEHKANSQHYVGQALDLNLFKDGVYLKETSDHAFSGAMWESRHLLCRWGGRWQDGNHYELRP